MMLGHLLAVQSLIGFLHGYQNRTRPACGRYTLGLDLLEQKLRVNTQLFRSDFEINPPTHHPP